MKRLWSKKSVTRRWQVRTGTVDIIGINAGTPMEAATLVFEMLHRDSKIESENRLYHIGMVVECRDIDRYKADPDNNTFFVLSSKVLANAGIHNLCKELEELEGEMDEEERL